MSIDSNNVAQTYRYFFKSDSDKQEFINLLFKAKSEFDGYVPKPLTRVHSKKRHFLSRKLHHKPSIRGVESKIEDLVKL